MSADWKKKYMDLRSQVLEIKDVSFRLGFEQGMKESQMQQVQQQAQEQAQAEAMAQGVDPETGEPLEQDPNQPMDEQGVPMEQGEEVPMDESQGTELDSHIQELENLVQKGEKPSVKDMRKAVEALATLRKSQKEKMKSNVPAMVSEQKKIVNKILAKWSKESTTASESIDKLIQDEGLKIEIK